MDIIHSLILGLVEGVTEFLPISSTGHLIIASRLFGLPESDFLKTFEIVIQLAAVMAVVILYWKRILANLILFFELIIAFIPTAIIGFLVYPAVKGLLLGSVTIVAWSLVIGGAVIICFEHWHRERHGVVGYANAFWAGLAQTLALIPGISRAAATIIGGEAAGMSRATAVEFSFMLAIPTMVAASGYDLYKNIHTVSIHGNLALLAVGCLAAFISALASVRWLLKYLQTHSLSAFGWYRIVIGLLLLLFLR